jgi:hypothetical protein
MPLLQLIETKKINHFYDIFIFLKLIIYFYIHNTKYINSLSDQI